MPHPGVVGADSKTHLKWGQRAKGRWLPQKGTSAIHSLNKQFLSYCSVPGTILISGFRVNKTLPEYGFRSPEDHMLGLLSTGDHLLRVKHTCV